MTFWMCIAVMVVASSYFNYKKTAARFGSKGNADSKEWKEMKKKVAFLVDENQDLKEDIEQIKISLGLEGEDSVSLDIERYRQKNEQLTDYEKEQIRIDDQSKFKY